MRKTVLTFGLISGVIISLFMIGTIPFHDQIGFDRGLVVGYAGMFAAFLLVYFGVRSYRDNVAGGSVKFGRAFAVGALIAIISSVMYSATWQVIWFGGFMPDFAAKYQAHVIESARADGATQQELDKTAAQQKKMWEMYQNPLFNFGLTLIEPLPVGLLIALISAAVVSRRRRTEGVMAAVG
jgi:hypothetical protein